MRILIWFVACLTAAASPAPASAADLCSTVADLFGPTRQGFDAYRGAPQSQQIWDAPIAIHGSHCTLWQSRAADADTLRCDIQRGGSPSEVADLYRKSVISLSACLARLPSLPAGWVTQAQPIKVDGLSGEETIWKADGDKELFKVELGLHHLTVRNEDLVYFVVERLAY